MSVAVVIPPYAEPIHLHEMKTHLKVELSMTEDDALIQSQITAARDVVETATGANCSRHMVMMATTFDEFHHCFPWWNPLTGQAYGYLALPRVPLVSVSSISYVDVGGVTQTWSSSLYTVDAARGRVHLAYNESWPSTRYQPNAVTVRFVAGMASPFTAVAATDIFTVLGRSFAVGDRVRVMNSGGQLPTGLQANTDYFVIAGPKLSLTAGGAAVDITSAGSGTHYIGLDLTGFETLRSAIKLLVAHHYTNREAVVLGSHPMALPFAVDALINSVHA